MKKKQVSFQIKHPTFESQQITLLREHQRNTWSLGYSSPRKLIKTLKTIKGLENSHFVFGPTPLLISLGSKNVIDLSKIIIEAIPPGLGVAYFNNKEDAASLSIDMAYHYGKAEFIIYDSLSPLINVKAEIPAPLPRTAEEMGAFNWADFFSLAAVVASKKAEKPDFYDLFMGDNVQSILHYDHFKISLPKDQNSIEHFKTSFCSYQKAYHGLNASAEPSQYECSTVTQLLMASFNAALLENPARKIMLPKGFYTKYLQDIKIIATHTQNERLLNDIRKIEDGNFEGLNQLNFYEDYNQLGEQIRSSPDALIMVCNPSNPPDKPLLSPVQTEEIHKRLTERHFIVEDAAYGDVILDPEKRKVTFQSKASKGSEAKIIHLRTPNKAIGTNGLRTGIAWINKQETQAEICSYLSEHGTNHSTSPHHNMTYHILNTIYSDQDFLMAFLLEYNTEVVEKKVAINSYLMSKDIPPIDHETGSFYTFIDLGKIDNPEKHWQTCLERGVAYVPGHVYGKFADDAHCYARLNSNNLPIDKITHIFDILYS